MTGIPKHVYTNKLDNIANKYNKTSQCNESETCQF